MFDAIYLAKAFLPPDKSWRIFRYLNAAHALIYVGLTGGKVYSTENFLSQLVLTHRLLSDKEMDRINIINPNLGGCATREVISWILDDIRDYVELSPGTKPPSHGSFVTDLSISELVSQILRFRGCVGQLFDYAGEKNEDSDLP